MNEEDERKVFTISNNSHRYGAMEQWSKVSLEKLRVCNLGQNFSAFYGTRRCITVFTTARFWSQSLARLILSMKTCSTALIMSSVKIDPVISVLYLETKMNIAQGFKHLLLYVVDVWHTRSAP